MKSISSKRIDIKEELLNTIYSYKNVALISVAAMMGGAGSAEAQVVIPSSTSTINLQTLSRDHLILTPLQRPS
ncbi:hypothetical protein HED55_23190 [Ochrobactrum haematophilum]|uniref:Uncharacterized protein n=1 Tax=Brucella haematophila TaxID=419474 RepID=A0ABX1DUU8_9HYPH|nr:hypothetical protein [Brucella haematophila]